MFISYWYNNYRLFVQFSKWIIISPSAMSLLDDTYSHFFKTSFCTSIPKNWNCSVTNSSVAIFCKLKERSQWKERKQKSANANQIIFCWVKDGLPVYKSNFKENKFHWNFKVNTACSKIHEKTTRKFSKKSV